MPTAVTAALGLYQINVPILWRDELATWSAASRTPPQLWAMVHNVDAVLGLYYLGLHLWMAAFGDSAAALRLPSALAMTGAAAVVALTGRRLGGTRVGLISGLIFAVIPSVSRYAQEARPYAFATLFAALATLLLLRAMERPTWLRWGCYALALAAVGASNLIALCVLAAHAAIVATDFSLRTVRIGDEDAAGGGRALPGGRPEPVAGRPLALLGWFSLAAIIGVALDAPIVIEGHAQSSSQIGQQPVPHVVALFGVIDGLWPELFSSTPVALAVIAARAGVGGDAHRRAAARPGRVRPGRRDPADRGGLDRLPGAGLLLDLPVHAVHRPGLGGGGRSRRRRDGRAPAAAATSPATRRARLAAGLRRGGDGARPGRRGARRPRPAGHTPAAGPQPVGLPGHDGERGTGRLPGGRGGDRSQPAPRRRHRLPGRDQNHYQVDAAIAYYLRGRPMPKAVFQAETPAQADDLQPVECGDPSTCLTEHPEDLGGLRRPVRVARWTRSRPSPRTKPAT